MSVSVKDRWVNPHEQVLNVPITCFIYWPSKPMYHVVNRYLAFITASMVVLGEKLGGEPVDHSVGLWVVSEALFLGNSRVHPTLLMACERLPRTCTVRTKRMWTGVEMYVLCVSGFPL
jgi:hypothetical protein